MKYSMVIPVLGLTMLLTDCSRESESPDEEQITAVEVAADNPLVRVSNLPYSLPPFDQILNEHFEPAISRGMELQRAEIAAIATNPEPATFENTLLAMERSGQDLERVLRVFNNAIGTITNSGLQAIERDMTPRLSRHEDAISLNPDLFARISQIYEQRETLGLDPESVYLVERYHTDFVRAGALLSEQEQERLREINAELARLNTLFRQNLLAEVNNSAVVVGTRAELDGLPETELQAAAHDATVLGYAGQYVLTLRNTSMQPVLTWLTNREVRERVHRASLARGSRGNEFDNTGVVSDTLKLRAERARMLGYETHADYVLADQTAQTVGAVNQLLADITPLAVANARDEGRDITSLIGQIESSPFDLQAWDWPYYAEMVRRERYDFDASEVRPYFELNSVLVNGVFYAASQLYGLSFLARDDLPVYYPDVQIWEVFDADGSARGLVLADFYARPSKRGGAWMSSYETASGLLGGDRVIAMHQNVTKPSAGAPTLLTFAEVTTMFHEFGHVLHGLLSEVEYPRFVGTNVPRDFVEFPSQINEMWAVWPEVLQNYARHHETGQPIPMQLLDKVIEAEQFNQGFATTEYLAASTLDQVFHQLTEDQVPAAENMMAFETQVLEANGFTYPPVSPRYRTPYFSHIMGGYSAGYYSYIWSEVMDADGVEWFKENGGLLRENGDHFRDTVLARGGSAEAMQLYNNFAGREPNIAHMLSRRGLLNNNPDQTETFN